MLTWNTSLALSITHEPRSFQEAKGFQWIQKSTHRTQKRKLVYAWVLEHWVSNIFTREPRSFQEAKGFRWINQLIKPKKESWFMLEYSSIEWVYFCSKEIKGDN